MFGNEFLIGLVRQVFPTQELELHANVPNASLLPLYAPYIRLAVVPLALHLVVT